jgi:membrane dipeptidase
MTFSRRHFIQTSSAAFAAGATMSWALPALGKPQDAASLLKEAQSLYSKSIVIDMLSEEELNETGLKYIVDSGVTCISPTLGVRRPENAKGTYMKAAFPYDAAVEDCAKYTRWIKENSTKLLQARTAGDIKRAKQEGKQSIMYNFQNSPLDGRLDSLDVFKALGVCSMQLTYNERNDIGDGSTERTNSGLSDFGIAVVERMNELGILVDSAHSGPQTTLDAVKFSKRPPVFSHTECFALSEHPRNKTDEMIRNLAEKGGVMGLTTVNPMIKRDLPVTMEDFIDHIDHIKKLVGVDFVGFGSDCLVRGWPTDPKEKDAFLGFYGDPYFKPSYNFRYPLGTEGMNDEHKWLSVTAGLIKRGYKEEEIKKIIGGNWLRVIGEVVG